jgi:RNA polymerase sigma-70 factor, ECF subfamily
MQVAAEIASREIVDDDLLERMMVERYPDLLRLAFLILHDRTDAEDATQLALERAWRSRAQVHSANLTLHWLRRIVVREALRSRSSPWRILRLPLRVGELEPPAEPRSLSGDSERIDLLRAFNRLPADQSAVVALHHYFSYPVAEVAEMLGIPLETARSRLRLAMKRLREELRDA